MQVVVGKSGGPAGQVLDSHDFAIGPMRHAIVIVAHQEDDGQTAFPNDRQMIGELRLGREIQRLQHHAVGKSAVPGKTTNHAVPVQVAVGQSRARGDGHPAADDGIGAQVTDREIGDVHRAAAPAAVSVVFAEQLPHCAIKVLFDGGLDQFVALGGVTLGHTPTQLLLAHLADGYRPFGEAFPVAAMGAGDVVGPLQRRARAGRRAFLARGNMGRAAIVEAPKWFVSAGTQLHDHLLEFPDDQHVLQQGHRLGRGEGSRAEFGLQRAWVAIRRNLAAIDFMRHESRARIAQVGRGFVHAIKRFRSRLTKP